MNNKGLTVVELIVTFALTTIIVYFLFQVVITMKQLYTEYGIKTELLTKQITLSEKINNDLTSKKLYATGLCGETCLTFVFNDLTIKELSFDRTDEMVTYGDYAFKLKEGSTIGNIEISSSRVVGINANNNNSILRISVPIYNQLLKQQNFGVNIVYPFDDRQTAISDTNIENYIDTPKKIYLKGATNMVAYTTSTFVDPGFLTVSSTGVITDNDIDVVITGNVGNTVGETYQLVYTIYDINSNIVDTVVRNVTKVNSVTNYTYKGTSEIFVAPVTGVYRIELWGAEGGTSVNSVKGGKGGYTVSNLELTKGDSIIITVGSKGNGITGGYNGGGNGYAGTTASGGGGGGATDVRSGGSNINNRILIAGGGGGAGSIAGAIGGVAGGTTGQDGQYVTIDMNGAGANATSGGAASTYTTGLTVNPTAGSLATGGIGGRYSTTTGGGGGGAGYYGGGGGARNGAGGGGNGYCGTLTNCTTYSGTETFSGINILDTEVGHTGNGHAKITIVSVNNDNQTNTVRNFSYTGSAQTFTVSATGTYKIELWGAEGALGMPGTEFNGGGGGYTTGRIHLTKDQEYYVYVGGIYNGAGQGLRSGGGATDIRLISGVWSDTSSLNSRIMVAAGGGGGGWRYSGGNAGGLTGYTGLLNNTTAAGYSGTGGTQNTGGSAGQGSTTLGVEGTLGTGGNGGNSGGGGGGYYGGGGGSYTVDVSRGGGGGGSSYISGHLGCTNHYSNKIFTNTVMIDGAGYNWTNVVGSLTEMPKPGGGYYDLGTGHTGNGYARITYLGN